MGRGEDIGVGNSVADQQVGGTFPKWITQYFKQFLMKNGQDPVIRNELAYLCS